jgi:voltage-gated potassium channel
MADRKDPLKNRLFVAGLALAAVLTIGTAGYWLFGGGAHSLLDCFYMTFITISTIGYGEIFDLGGSPGGRVFTMVIATSGIGLMTYMLVSFTAFVLEGELNETVRRRKMEKKVENLRGHYIVCGPEGVGRYILEELASTARVHVLVGETHDEEIDRLAGIFEGLLYIKGDPTDEDILAKAGIAHAEGLFAVTEDDNRNLVISLTARQAKPGLKIIASCENMKNAVKIRAAGASAVISPSYIGGLRMASEMLRPSVVTFLDTMLRHDDSDLRIEEIPVPQGYAGKTLADLDLQKFRKSLLLAFRSGERWHYNPPRNSTMNKGDVLILMTSADERKEFEKRLNEPSA